MTSPDDAALGAVLGALIGDAAGATLEFLGRQPTAADVTEALRLPGGGVWRVAPGQITDDGELTMCLARALADSPTGDLDRIATGYAGWLSSRPFDVGNTTRNALSLHGAARSGEPPTAAAMTAAARRSNMGSKANGSLMRCTPLGVWGHRLSDDALVGLASADSGLTHPNQSCGDAVSCYVLALAELIARPGSREAAWARARGWGERAANDEVRSWLAMIDRNEHVPAHPQAGFVKIAFTYAFRHLNAGHDYLTALRQTLLAGGDTDTNACIVGGLVGAAVGASGLPAAMKRAVIDVDTSRGQPRPVSLAPHDIEPLVQRLLDAAPSTWRQ